MVIAINGTVGLAEGIIDAVIPYLCIKSAWPEKCLV